MQIDILSDLHINGWSKHLFPDEKEVRRIWEPLNPKGDVLIIAGDIGEVPLQNVSFLKQLKELLLQRDHLCPWKSRFALSVQPKSLSLR